MSHLDTTRKAQRLAATGNVQHGKALGFGFGAVNDVRQQSGHIVHMNKLKAVFKILFSLGQHAMKPLALVTHS